MEELYSETYLKARPSTKRTLARAGLIVLCLLLIYIAVLMQNPIVMVIAVIADGLIIYFMPSGNIAYEYVFVDGQIDFDMIIAGNKRKTKKRADLEKIDIVAPEDSPSLNQYKNLPLSDFSSGVKSDRHFIAVLRTESGQEMVKFTPDEKLIENMKFKSKSKIQC